MEIKETKKGQNELSISTSNLTDEEEKNGKDDKITVEYLHNIISTPDEVPQKNNQENTNEKLYHNRNNRIKDNEVMESELERIRKKNLSKYLMVNDNFKSSGVESEEEIYQNKEIKPTKRQLYKFVGRTLFIFLDKYENPLLIIGPHWPLYLCFCGIVSLLMLCIYLNIWNNLGIVMRTIGHICFWGYFLSYTYCSLRNPGFPKNDLGRAVGVPHEQYSYCNLCHFYVKNNRYATHCSSCDICIENFDHHCPWTGHCIGKNNYYSFYAFVIFSFSIIIYIAVAVSVGLTSH